jgi:2-methylisocitrate lyase-like PEP mutase family enzyme
MPSKTFRQAVDEANQEGLPLILPGAHDGLSARLIKQAGFTAYFIGGFPVVAARYGVPDLGLKSLGEISQSVYEMMSVNDTPVLVDADDGYGDVKNVVHTVHTYERMGVHALCFEDQTWPKRCGHIAGKTVIPMEQMEAKIRAAVSERMHKTTFIQARTDARLVNGLDDALKRAERYVEAGADGIFIEAMTSVEEMERVGRMFKGVIRFASRLEGGFTPNIPMEDIYRLGYNVIVPGLTVIMHVANAIKRVAADIKSRKFALHGEIMPFDEFKQVLGLDDWGRIEDAYGPAKRR